MRLKKLYADVVHYLSSDAGVWQCNINCLAFKSRLLFVFLFKCDPVCSVKSEGGLLLNVNALSMSIITLFSLRQ